jgi:hypothetical protein
MGRPRHGSILPNQVPCNFCTISTQRMSLRDTSLSTLGTANFTWYLRKEGDTLSSTTHSVSTGKGGDPRSRGSGQLLATRSRLISAKQCLKKATSPYRSTWYLAEHQPALFPLPLHAIRTLHDRSTLDILHPYLLCSLLLVVPDSSLSRLSLSLVFLSLLFLSLSTPNFSLSRSHFFKSPIFTP